MRDFHLPDVPRSGLALWAAVLLALPGCSFQAGGLGPANNLYPGPTPRTSAIFCDIEKVLGRRCATAADLATGIRLSEAAVALNTGRTSTIGLDESPEARARCAGQPEAVLFEGPFPEGFPVCVNCGSVVGTAAYPDVDAACQAQCFDFYGTTAADGTLVPDYPPSPVVREFCEARARAAVNQPGNACFAGACSEPGTLLPDFLDPRRTPEPVIWQDLVGVAVGGSGADLIRTAPDSPAGFDAGAASVQQILRGDAFVEFSASRNDQGHVIGFTELPDPCPAPCTDTDPTLASIDVGLALSTGGRVGIVENGTSIPGPDLDGTFGPYTPGERFRVRLRDNSDGTAVVSFSRLVGPCTPGMLCNEAVFFTRPARVSYPLRVDASLRQVTATLTDVRLVHIQ